MGVGFVGAGLARYALRPTPEVPFPKQTTTLVQTFEAPAGTLSEIESLLTSARQASRTPAQLRELQRAVDRWLLADPEACIAWLENRGATGLIRKELLASVCAFRLDGSMVKAMRMAARISNPLLHYAFVSAAFETAAEIHPEEAFDALASMPDSKRSKLTQDLVIPWARKDPRKAWETVAAPSNSLEVIQLAQLCMLIWERKDSRGLQAYLREQLARPGRKMALEVGLWALATERPATILQLLSSRERNSRLQSIWQRALSSLERDGDPAPGLQVARMEPAGARREFALLGVGFGLVQGEKPQRLEEVLRELNPDSRRELERMQTSYSVVRCRPADVSAFTDGLPDGFTRATAMSSYVQGVLKHQTQALVEMALDASTPEVGPDWLDMIASNLRTDPVTSKAGGEEWIGKLDSPTRERLGPELQRRLRPTDWNRIQPHFQNSLR